MMAARRGLLLALAGGALAAAIVWRISESPRGQVLAAAPDFRLALAGGGTMSLGGCRGKVVLVHFWATWCESCRTEMATLESLHERYGRRGFVLLAVSVDEDGARSVAPFAAKSRLSFPILLADRGIQQAYGVFGLPASFLVGADGSILRKYAGPVESKALEDDVLAALASR